MTQAKKASSAKGKAAAAPKPSPIAAPSKSAGRNFIQAWRLFRNIPSQQELARLTIAHDPDGKGLERATINRLETGVASYREEHIAILSKTLRVSPRDLIGTDPYNSGDIFMVYAGLSAADKRRTQKFLASLKR